MTQRLGPAGPRAVVVTTQGPFLGVGERGGIIWKWGSGQVTFKHVMGGLAGQVMFKHVMGGLAVSAEI